MHAHVFLIADRHAGNNDAVAEDIAARRRIGMDSDLLRAAAIAVRDPERELLALVPFAVIGGADRTLRVLAEIPRVATREALGFRDRDRGPSPPLAKRWGMGGSSLRERCRVSDLTK